MSVELKGNPNYAAQVVRVSMLTTLPELDNLRGLPVGGYQALVSKDTQVGDLLVVFPAECQLSHKFVSANNLYRHANLNADSEQTGYLEDNRRVRAIKMRGHNSNALAMPVSIIDPTLTEGDTFDTVDGVELCRKYELKTKNPTGPKTQAKLWKRVEDKFLPEHIDTENYWRNVHLLAPTDHVMVSQKIHGTSIRLGNTIVKRKLSWLERLAKRFGIRVQETEFDYVFGSRKVIKDPNNSNQNHYYDSDIWTTEGLKYAALIPQNVILYGELIGWTANGAPIQENYTYNVPHGEAHLYIYRVAVVTNDGHLYDLSWEGVKEFCTERGLKYVPELWSGEHQDFVAEDWLDWEFSTYYPTALPLSKGSPCDEGIVLRREGVLPLALKAKSPVFLGHETKMLDKEVVDIEAEG